MIVDRCNPPSTDRCQPKLLKAVLWSIKSFGAPGAIIKTSRERIASRAQYSVRAVDDAIRALTKELGAMEQLAAPSAGSPAQYRLNYRVLIGWLDDEDREYFERLFGPTHATSAGVQRTQPVQASENTHATTSTNARNDCAQRTQPLLGPHATSAGVIKEVRAGRARTAPPAPADGPPDTEIDRWLRNLAIGGGAGGVGVMDEEAWSRLAHFAGIGVASLRDDLAVILTARGIEDASVGVAAMEKLKDRMDSKQARNPKALFTSFLDPSKDQTGECKRTRNRRKDEEDGHRMARMKIEHQWSEAMNRRVYGRLRVFLLEHLGEKRTGHVLDAWRRYETVRDWDAMIALIAANYNAWTRAEPVREAVSA
ncbi:MAG: hypothetical protein ACX94C_07595 [Phycisphaerales bacterium]